MSETLNLLVRQLTDTLQGWAMDGFALVPHVVVAGVVVVATLFLARNARRAAAEVIRRTDIPPVMGGLAERLVHGAVIAVGLLVVLSLLGLDKPLTSMLAGAGIAGIAIGFAFQHTFANFIASITLGLRRPFHVGDLVQIGDWRGRIEESDLRVTVLRTFQGQTVRIPNKTIVENTIVNYSTGARRVDIEVGVAYDSDLPNVLALTRQALERLDGRLEDRPVQAWVTGFGASSIDLVGQVWIEPDDEPGFLKARSEAMTKLKQAYDAHDIDIPFPIRTLRMPEAVEAVQLAAK